VVAVAAAGHEHGELGADLFLDLRRLRHLADIDATLEHQVVAELALQSEDVHPRLLLQWLEGIDTSLDQVGDQGHDATARVEPGIHPTVMTPVAHPLVGRLHYVAVAPR